MVAGRGKRGGLHGELPLEWGFDRTLDYENPFNDTRDAGWEFTDIERSQAGVIEDENLLKQGGKHADHLDSVRGVTKCKFIVPMRVTPTTSVGVPIVAGMQNLSR